MNILTEKDFVLLDWLTYQNYIEFLASEIQSFLIKENLHIDFIVPIFRGGGIPAISLSYQMDIFEFHILQMKHEYKSGVINTFTNSIEQINDKNKPYIILLVDGYHATGRTTYLAYDTIKEQLPNARLMYTTIGRDIAFKKNERDFLFSCHAFFSNECGVISKEKSEQEGILTKYTLFPWEKLEDEIKNMNDEIKYGG